MALKLNSISRDVFEVKSKNDTTVRFNSTKTISRNDIIASGRIVACEYVGSKLNDRKGQIEKYNSRLASEGIDYASFAKNHHENKLMFCATMANKEIGKDAPVSIDEVKNDISYATNATFLRTMAAIDRDVLTPLMFSVFDDVSAGGLMQWTPLSFGGTQQIDIRSNDVFLFEDSSFGSSKSTTKNYLHGKTVTLNPTAYSCNATIYWYRDVVNGDSGYYYAAIMRGMWNKIYAKFLSALKNAANGTAYIPEGLQATTYTTANWLAITEKIAAVNGVRRSDLLAFGTATALSNLLPVDGTGGAIAGLQYGLGEEWFTQGYLPKASAVDVVEVPPVIVPGTQNSTIQTMDFEDSIYIMAKAGMGYAPIYGAYFEGSPLTLTATPKETADLTIDINVTAMFDVKPVLASKVGVIKAVYPTA